MHFCLIRLSFNFSFICLFNISFLSIYTRLSPHTLNISVQMTQNLNSIKKPDLNEHTENPQASFKQKQGIQQYFQARNGTLMLLASGLSQPSEIPRKAESK